MEHIIKKWNINEENIMKAQALKKGEVRKTLWKAQLTIKMFS